MGGAWLGFVVGWQGGHVTAGSAQPSAPSVHVESGYEIAIMIIIIPIGLIIRLITCCIDACYKKAAERRARREEERLAAEQDHVQTTVTVVQGAEAPSMPSVAPSYPPPPYSASDPVYKANERTPLMDK